MRFHLVGTLRTRVVPSNIVLDRGPSLPWEWGRFGISESPVHSDAIYCESILVVFLLGPMLKCRYTCCSRHHRVVIIRRRR